MHRERSTADGRQREMPRVRERPRDRERGSRRGKRTG
jgi:hypothetical protein